MEYLYHLGNASITLRVVRYLAENPHLRVAFLSVIHQINGWVIRVKLEADPGPLVVGNLRAYLQELGIALVPPSPVKMALQSLEAGRSPVQVMHEYQIAVVSHGHPDQEEIETFRRQFVRGLGYCPETLA